ncbi:cupin domain-containing protein [Sphingobium scionense]|uniref:Cupin 2 domain-containing protein n=1 Tax=Sphingobium scionense TaxID=1404341 RepID=A0A7W6LMU8_9SPHN|nr:cupin domain-containing protein [Sphingobium scionense]MBB4147288.1 cupin 2 domain-containing protein [Sphingobium scionense]
MAAQTNSYIFLSIIKHDALMNIPISTSTNLLNIPDTSTDDERFEELLQRPGVRIERIISHGHITPAEHPYFQAWDEWVLLLSGSAELELDGMGHHHLQAGDHLLIPAGVAHRVTYSDDPTIWLAVHIGDK